MIWNKMNGIAPAFTVRFSHEYLIWYYKGRLPPIATEQRGKFTTVFEERSRQHSRKPDFCYRMMTPCIPVAVRWMCFHGSTGKDGISTGTKRIFSTRVQKPLNECKRKIMKRLLFMLLTCVLCFCNKANAQWVVTDPGNFAQSIINASNNIMHTSKTATNMVSNFQETVKIYEQGKKYYDALKSVNNLVKDARKVQQVILMVGDITDIYVNSFQKMLHDENFTPEELSAIAYGYTKLLEESNNVLTDMKNVVNITTLSMTDKDRMDVVDRCSNP